MGFDVGRIEGEMAEGLVASSCVPGSGGSGGLVDAAEDPATPPRVSGLISPRAEAVDADRGHHGHRSRSWIQP